MFVSVIMPVYNSARFLRPALDSVLAQTHRDFEFVIIDDGSTDNSPEIMAEAAARDSRIRIIRQDNQGGAAARNRALKECHAEWVASVDADDMMLPERLARQIAFIGRYPEVKVFASRAYYIDERDRILGKTKLEPFATPEQFHSYLAKGGILGLNHPSVMFHLPTIQAVGGYRVQFPLSQDLDLWNRVAEAGHLVLLQDELLTKYRIHGASEVASKAYAMMLDFEYMKACILARRAGQAEPTRAQFEARWASRPWSERLATKLFHEANINYRAAAFDLACGRYLKGLGRLLYAGCCRPDYVLGRLATQFTPNVFRRSGTEPQSGQPA